MTPSFNQARFLEETIESVVTQGYPNLEYMIIDGGSSDGSVEIIKKYANHLAYWVSEPDRGQSHALNKGFSRASGVIFAWINSDDVYLPGCLSAIADAYVTNQGSLIAGKVLVSDERSRGIMAQRAISNASLSFTGLVRFWEEEAPLGQPGLFLPAHIWRHAGGVDEHLNYAMDYALLCKVLQLVPLAPLDQAVARFRLHARSKTGINATAMFLETFDISRSYWRAVGVPDKPSRRVLVDHLIRHVGAEVLAGRIVSGLRIFRLALGLDPASAFENLAIQALTGVYRRTRDGV